MIRVYITQVPSPHTRPIASRTAYALLRYAMASLGYAPEALTVSRTPEGKPYFQDIEMEFSISHSREWAVCAISPKLVGIDIERIRSVSKRLWERYLAADPNEPYRGDREAILRWTRYEAALKQRGKASPQPPPAHWFHTMEAADGYLLTLCGEGEIAPLHRVSPEALSLHEPL